jgi:hypothetical protein
MPLSFTSCSQIEHVFAPFLYKFDYIGVRICSKEATVKDFLYLALLVGFFAVFCGAGVWLPAIDGGRL